MEAEATGWRVGRRASTLAGLALLAGGMLTAQTTEASRAALTSGESSAGTAIKLARASTSTAPHIMMIVDENTSYQSTDGNPFVIGNASAPYLNSLASTYTSLNNWYSYEHMSSLDYYDLISGIDQKGNKKPYLGTTLINELDSAGYTWKAYMDGLRSRADLLHGDRVGHANHYVQGHNPFVALQTDHQQHQRVQCQSDPLFAQSRLHTI